MSISCPRLPFAALLAEIEQKSMNNCNESVLSDIVRVSVYNAEDCTIPVPPQVSLSAIKVRSLFASAPVIEFSAVYDDGVVQLSSSPSLKVTEEVQAAGYIYTHELQLTCNELSAEQRKAMNSVSLCGFHIVCEHADGSRSLVYALPGTSRCSSELNFDRGVVTTVKLHALSVSSLIKI